MEQGQRYAPYDPIRGEVPGRRLRSLSDSRTTMAPLADRVQQLIREAAPGF